MPDLGEYRTAVRMHRVIRAIARRVVAEERPDYRYGTVTDIQNGADECRVLLNGDTVPTVVSIAHVRPVTGEQVRVAGRRGDRYIASLMLGNTGYSRIIPGMIMLWPLTIPPDGWLFTDGSSQLILTYPGLYFVYGTTFGGDGITTFNLPNLPATSGVKYIVKY